MIIIIIRVKHQQLYIFLLSVPAIVHVDFYV
jgi:hypothetical protein